MATLVKTRLLMKIVGCLEPLLIRKWYSLATTCVPRMQGSINLTKTEGHTEGVDGASNNSNTPHHTLQRHPTIIHGRESNVTAGH